MELASWFDCWVQTKIIHPTYKFKHLGSFVNKSIHVSLQLSAENADYQNMGTFSVGFCDSFGFRGKKQRYNLIVLSSLIRRQDFRQNLH